MRSGRPPQKASATPPAMAPAGRPGAALPDPAVLAVHLGGAPLGLLQRLPERADAEVLEEGLDLQNL